MYPISDKLSSLVISNVYILLFGGCVKIKTSFGFLLTFCSDKMFCIIHCFRYLAGENDETGADDEDLDGNDEEPNETDDEDNDPEFDPKLYNQQVEKIQQKAITRFSSLPQRDTRRLLNRSQKAPT